MSSAIASSQSVTRARDGLAVSAPALGAFAVTIGLGFANGGYFPESWSWASLGLLWAALVALLVRPAVAVGRVELIWVSVATALVGWTWLSTVWSSEATNPVLEGQRALILFGGVTAAVLVAERRTVKPLLGGILVAITIICLYALATRLFPERLGSFDSVAVYRLSTPVGYWNGLGAVAAIGVVLAAGFVARGARRSARALASGSTVVLLPTLYFTFGRGPWIALGLGLVAAVAIDPGRLQFVTSLLVVAPGPSLAIVLASHSEALTHLRSPLARASHDGHWLALALLLIVLAQLVVAFAYVALERRISPRRALRATYASVLVAAVAAALAALFVQYGSPAHLARHAYHSFVAKPHPTFSNDLNAHLLSFSGSGRVDAWRVAWHEYEANPVLGSGAGSFEQYWMQKRPYAAQASDAHNLYLETLAELGPVGLALLLGLFAIPTVVAFRARRQPLVPVALGALTVYLVHAFADWDWELAGITLIAVFCATACLLAAREPTQARPLTPGQRAAAGLTLVLVSGIALAGLPGTSALSAAGAAARAGDWTAAASRAHTAIRWTPWSAEGWQQLGEAQLALGELPAARRSLSKAIAKDQQNWVLWLDLAAASRAAERRAALAQARRLNPLGPEVRSFSRGL